MKKLFNKKYIVFLLFLLIVILSLIYILKYNNVSENILDPKLPPLKIQNVWETLDNNF
jgi:hypothetical protein